MNIFNELEHLTQEHRKPENNSSHMHHELYSDHEGWRHAWAGVRHCEKTTNLLPELVIGGLFVAGIIEAFSNKTNDAVATNTDTQINQASQSTTIG